MDQAVNPQTTIEFIVLGPHGRPVTVDQISNATEIQMINWRTDDMMKEPGATLDPISEPDVEAAWSAEIKRRLVEIDAGTVEFIPWDDVRSELFGEFGWRE